MDNRPSSPFGSAPDRRRWALWCERDRPVPSGGRRTVLLAIDQDRQVDEFEYERRLRWGLNG